MSLFETVTSAGQPVTTDGTAWTTGDLVAVSAADQLDVGTAETATVAVAGLVEVTASDTLFVTLGTAVGGEVALTGSDVLTVGVVEQSTRETLGQVTRDANDALGLGVLEDEAVEVGLAASDGLGVSVADQAAIEAKALEASDGLALGLSESTDVAIFASLAKDATDTLSVGVADATSRDIQLDQDDVLPLDIGEQASVHASLSAQDEATVGLIEDAWNHLARTSSDQTGVQIDEDAAVAISGLVEVAASDSLDVATDETVVVPLEASDALALGLDENGVVALALQQSAQDVIAPSLGEQSSLETEEVDLFTYLVEFTTTLDALLLSFWELQAPRPSPLSTPRSPPLRVTRPPELRGRQRSIQTSFVVRGLALAITSDDMRLDPSRFPVMPSPLSVGVEQPEPMRDIRTRATDELAFEILDLDMVHEGPVLELTTDPADLSLGTNLPDPELTSAAPPNLEIVTVGPVEGMLVDVLEPLAAIEALDLNLETTPLKGGSDGAG